MYCIEMEKIADLNICQPTVTRLQGALENKGMFKASAFWVLSVAVAVSN